MDEIVLLYTTWPDPETAQTVARAAVSARLAACANILAPMVSVYPWAGAVQTESECVMLLKSKESCSDALRTLILESHPYAIPCLIAFPVNSNASNTDFLNWISEQTGPVPDAVNTNVD